MRKISSERDSERRKRRNTLILSLLMLLVLVFGTAGYAFSSSSRTSSQDGITSGGGEVVFTGSRWRATVDGQDFYFINSPESVENISVDTSVFLSTYAGSPLYLVSDNNAVNVEIASVLEGYASRVQESCYGPCDKDLPEKNCTENLIIWEDSTENRVYQEENCVFIKGDLRTVDAFLYNLLGFNNNKVFKR